MAQHKGIQNEAEIVKGTYNIFEEYFFDAHMKQK